MDAERARYEPWMVNIKRYEAMKKTTAASDESSAT